MTHHITLTQDHTQQTVVESSLCRNFLTKTGNWKHIKKFIGIQAQTKIGILKTQSMRSKSKIENCINFSQRVGKFTVQPSLRIKVVTSQPWAWYLVLAWQQEPCVQQYTLDTQDLLNYAMGIISYICIQQNFLECLDCNNHRTQWITTSAADRPERVI